MRDLRKIWVKIKYVVNPTGAQEDTLRELRNWDLMMSHAAVHCLRRLRLGWSLRTPPAGGHTTTTVLGT